MRASSNQKSKMSHKNQKIELYLKKISLVKNCLERISLTFRLKIKEKLKDYFLIKEILKKRAIRETY